MPADDLDACMRRCVEGGFGAFTVAGNPPSAFFRSQSVDECRSSVVAAEGATLYLYVRKHDVAPGTRGEDEELID
jgi:hypothetical protein